MTSQSFVKEKSLRFVLIYLLIGNLWLFFFTWRQTFNLNGNRTLSLFDDALISMSYAKTFSQTGELVWFPGADRIQGITNPLWTLILSLFHLISSNPKTIICLVVIFGFITINFSAFLVYKILGLVLPANKLSTAIQIAASVSIPFQYSFVYWTLRGLEVGILSLVLLLTIFTILKNPMLKIYFKDYLLITFLGLIGAAIRFDYVLIHLVVIIFLTLFKKLNFLNRFKFLKSALILASLFIVTGVILIWQKIYYGEFLPNTYYLKVSGFELHSRVIRGLLSILKSYLTPIVLLLSTIFLISKKQENKSFKEFFVLNCTIFFTVICYVVYIGGDAWEVYGKINRFLSVVQPLLIITVGMGAYLLLSFKPKQANPYKLLALLFVASSLGYGIRINPIRYSFVFVCVVLIFYLFVLSSITRVSTVRFPAVNLLIFFIFSMNTLAFASWFQSGAKDGLDLADQQNYQIALDIREILYRDGKAAVIFAGAPVYFSNRSAIDLLGKNDSYIARQKPNFQDFIGEWNSSFYPGHNKWDFDYSIGFLKPDMVAQSWGETPMQDFDYIKFCLIGTDRFYYLNSTSKNIWWHKLERC